MQSYKNVCLILILSLRFHSKMLDCNTPSLCLSLHLVLFLPAEGNDIFHFPPLVLFPLKERVYVNEISLFIKHLNISGPLSSSFQKKKLQPISMDFTYRVIIYNMMRAQTSAATNYLQQVANVFQILLMKIIK